MRLARLLKILTSIQSNPNLGVADLAERCEMSVRTAYRDLDALKAAGVPIYCDKGYKISPGFFLPPLKFTFNEAIALIVGAGAFIKHQGTPYSRPADEAFRVRIRFKGKAADIINESTYHPTQELKPDGANGVIMSANVSDPMEMLPWIIGFGVDVEVLEPEDLRRSIADNAAAVTAVYSNPND